MDRRYMVLNYSSIGNAKAEAGMGDGWIVNKKIGTERPENISPATWFHCKPKDRQTLIEIASKEMEGIRKARALRDIPREHRPFDQAEGDGSKLKPMQYGLPMLDQKGPHGSANEDEEVTCQACESDGESEEGNVCSRCFKLLCHIDKNGQAHQVY